MAAVRGAGGSRKGRFCRPARGADGQLLDARLELAEAVAFEELFARDPLLLVPELATQLQALAASPGSRPIDAA